MVETTIQNLNIYLNGGGGKTIDKKIEIIVLKQLLKTEEYRITTVINSVLEYFE